ncbi:MAG: hydrogenase expression/formation protein HypE [Myxococcota bacterium]
MKMEDRILLSHGSGGALTRRLIEELLAPAFDNPLLAPLEDQAIIERPSERIAFTTDSFVVSPIFFPGGDIGKLAVYGTVNDLAVGGATPRYLSLSMIIEEGFLASDLKKIVQSISNACKKARVEVVTGDTKVVERGKGDGIYITTSGIGFVPDGVTLSSSSLKEGDKILVSGGLAEHGFAILAKRKGLSFASAIESDCAPITNLCKALVEVGGNELKAMRDPTRGGLSAVLNEWSLSSNVGIEIDEASLPFSESVRAASEMLGLDALSVASEGRVVAAVGREAATACLEALKKIPDGKGAAIVGEVSSSGAGRVIMKTSVGGRRLVHLPTGEQLPRIC